MKKSKQFFFSILIVAFGVGTLHAQTQTGIDIDGEVTGDESGYSVSMPDASTVAIGAIANAGNGSEAGQVRIYTWNGSTWLQKGADIDGEAAGDQSGFSVSMPDNNTVAIGAHYNEANWIQAGQVRIYTWDGSTWVQKGVDIDGVQGSCLGHSVSMPDANTVAIGAAYYNGNLPLAGQVKIYTWDGSAWVQKGADIDGESAYDASGYSVSMPDSNTVAIGAPYYTGNGVDSGQVRIYTWNGSAWVQKGIDIDGEAAGDRSGYSVSMPDANTVAIGAIENSGNGDNAGHVRIYAWNGSSWVQQGSDIDGEALYDLSGNSVSMPDVNTVAIGAPGNSGNGTSSGHVRMYTWNGSIWIQQGVDIDGEAIGDYSGYSVSMPDANTVAIGTPYNDGNGNAAGQVRVYSIGTGVGIVESALETMVSCYPNPNSGTLSIDLGARFNDITVVITNVMGQRVQTGKYNATQKLDLNITADPGIYFVQITADDKREVIKVIKE
ncbi:MAG: T9SS type A sorting domain-containing protein [Bacteroidia bacterium]|nr:T9SS type A sorting domain-containing protein [Bacteroidia bacterium]